MNLKMRCNLWQEKRNISPDGKFKADLWSRLDTKMHADCGTKHSWFETRAFKFAAAAAAFILVAACTGTGAYAYSSPDVTDGTPLYPVKQKMEKIAEKLQTTPEAKAKFYLNQIKRREAEEAVMKKKGAIQEQVARMEDKITQAESNLEKINSVAEKYNYKDENLHAAVRARLQQRIDQNRENLQGRIQKMELKKERLNENLQNLNVN